MRELRAVIARTVAALAAVATLVLWPSQTVAEEPSASYAPQSGPVGTQVVISGNVGSATLEAYAESTVHKIRVDLWKHAPPYAYRLTIGEFPYDSEGNFRGVAEIPAGLAAWQAPPDTPGYGVVPGQYEIRLHPVDVGLLPFTVTAGEGLGDPAPGTGLDDSETSLNTSVLVALGAIGAAAAAFGALLVRRRLIRSS